MNTAKINGRDLLSLGFPEGKALGTALAILSSAYKGKTREHTLALLGRVLETPALYKEHAILAPLAADLLAPEKEETIALRPEKLNFSIYGAEGIEAGALNQMEIAMRLPVAKAGALMPDAHQGYGLPIGGVLATENAVIPYGVGVDIGCRMCMTIYDMPADFLEEKREPLKKTLLDNTRFGRATFQKPKEHAVIDRPEFNEIAMLRGQKDRAFSRVH